MNREVVQQFESHRSPPQPANGADSESDSEGSPSQSGTTIAAHRRKNDYPEDDDIVGPLEDSGFQSSSAGARSSKKSSKDKERDKEREKRRKRSKKRSKSTTVGALLQQKDK